MTYQIKVTNKNSFEIKDYFEGLCYQFLPNEPVTMPLDAIQHIFGVQFPADEAELTSPAFQEKIFQSVSRRWGLNGASAEAIAKNKKIISNFSFLPVTLKMVEVVADNSAMPEPREQKPVIKTAKLGKYLAKPETEETSEEEVA